MIVATADKLAFKMNTVLKPFTYPCSRMNVACFCEMLTDVGCDSRAGSSIILLMRSSGNDSPCIEERRVLLLEKVNERSV